MRKKSMFSTVLVLLVIAALAAGGYTFFKDMDGPAVQVTPNTGRVSPATVLQIHMNDPSGIRSLTVGIRKNNVLNVIFNRHFDEYLPERVVDVPLKDSNLREGAFDLEIRATDGSLAGFGQGNTRTVQLPMRLDTQPPRPLPLLRRRHGPPHVASASGPRTRPDSHAQGPSALLRLTDRPHQDAQRGA